MKDEYETISKKKVSYDVIYTGETDWDVKNGKTYKCIAEWYNNEGMLDSISMIDETGQAYIYDVGTFKKA